jgi:hypothetical protein
MEKFILMHSIISAVPYQAHMSSFLLPVLFWSEYISESFNEYFRIFLCLMQADYGLLKSCEADFEKYRVEYKCNVEGKSPHGSLAGVLLCLENALNDGKILSLGPLLITVLLCKY